MRIVDALGRDRFAGESLRHGMAYWFTFAILLLADFSPTAGSVPNIILIMADDLGYGDLSCYGGAIDTPHIDRLAKEGLRFTDFHSSGHVCSPTRAGLMTGRYQRRAGIPGVVYANPNQTSHFTGLPVSEVTFAELLRAKGYQTGLIGKWHLGYSRRFNPLHHGFSEFRGYVSGNVDYQSHRDGMDRFDWWNGLRLNHESGYVTRLITKHAVDFINRHHDRPFCLYVAHEAVHYPWQGPHDPPQRGPHKTDPADVDKDRAFREMLIEMDDSVGAIRAAVEHHHMASRTVVLFFSDNGPDHGSSGPLRGKKGTNWEGGHRVPCIAWWPDQIASGRQTDQLAITLDIMPTILELAKTELGATTCDGRSLVDLLLDGATLGRRRLFWNNKAVRDGPWKLIRQGKGGPELGLYHLGNDLAERHNLADQHPDRVSELLRAMEAWYQDVTGKR